MEHATEKSLIIKSLVNQTPFEDEAVRSFLNCDYSLIVLKY